MTGNIISRTEKSIGTNGTNYKRGVSHDKKGTYKALFIVCGEPVFCRHRGGIHKTWGNGRLAHFLRCKRDELQI